MLNHLIIFIKNPEKGKVKTRISATEGEATALEIYNQLLSITKTIVLNSVCERHLYYSDFIDKNDGWHDRYFIKHCQRGLDLGQRMQHAFTEVFENIPTKNKKVLIVGSDCPEIDSTIIDKAFSILEKKDFAIGPTFDGGYYLLGMNDLRPQIFENIAWSTDSVLAATLRNIGDLSLSFELLPTLNDIDTFSDWESYMSKMAHN